MTYYLNRFAAAGLLAGFLCGQAEASSPEKTEGGLRVLSYNIRYDNRGDGANRWTHRKDTVARVIEEHADVAGLQEVLKHQLTDLQERLPNFAVYGVGRDDGKERGEYAPILYHQERFELLDSGTFWLSTTPEQAGSRGWDAALPRIASWVKLKDKSTGREFIFANTHFDHQGAEARQESAKLLAARLPKLAGDLPVVLTGDFNARPDSGPVSMLTTTFHDSRALAEKPQGPDGTWNGFSKIVPGQRIDFIFVTAGTAVAAHETLDPRTQDERFASDHLPVSATVKLKP